jgi:hypothetical protein
VGRGSVLVDLLGWSMGPEVLVVAGKMGMLLSSAILFSLSPRFHEVFFDPAG